MKKLIIGLLIALLTASTAYAIDADLSYTILGKSNLYFHDNPENPVQFKTSVEVGHRWEWLRMYTLLEAWMDDAEGMQYHPASQAYTVGIQIIHEESGMYFELGHYCQHPIGKAESRKTVYQADMFTIGWKYGKK